MLDEQGEVYIRGKKRDGLISDEEISGLRIGLVCASSGILFSSVSFEVVSNVMSIQQVFQSAALFDSLTVRENVGFLL